MGFTREDLIPTSSRSVLRKRLCVTVLWNTLDTTVANQRGRKLSYALPMRSDSEETPNLKKFYVKNNSFKWLQV